MRENRGRGLIGLALLLTTLLACRPVIAIGWQEMAVVAVIVAILVGPLLFRLYRFFTRLQKSQDRKEEPGRKGE